MVEDEWGIGASIECEDVPVNQAVVTSVITPVSVDETIDVTGWSKRQLVASSSLQVAGNSPEPFPVNAARILKVLRECSCGVGDIRLCPNSTVHKGAHRFAVGDASHVVILA